MKTFEKLDNPENYYTNIINFNEEDFINKLINKSEVRVDVVVLRKENYLANKSKKINYEILSKNIKEEIKNTLGIKDVNDKNIKYKKIIINESVFVLFVNNKSKSNKLNEFYKHIIKTKPELKSFFIKSIFDLLLKIEMIDMEERGGGIIEDDQYNDNPRYVLNSKELSNGEYVFDVLEVETSIRNGRISTNIKAKRYKSKNNPTNELLLNEEITKFGRSKIKLMDTKVSEKKNQKLYYYQLVDKIIKKLVFEKNGIDYSEETFDYNYKFSGGDKMIAGIKDDKFIEVKLISTLGFKEVADDERAYLETFLSYLLINSDQKIWDKVNLDRVKFKNLIREFEDKYKNDKYFKKMFIKESKSIRIKIVEVLFMDDIKDFNLLSKDDNFLILNLKDDKTNSSFKCNDEYIDDVNSTLDIFKEKNFNKLDLFDFYTRLKVYNLVNGRDLVLQGIDLSIKDLASNSGELNGMIYPNIYLQDTIKKVNDELLIKSKSKRYHINVLTNKNNPLKLDKSFYTAFYFHKKKDGKKNILFATVMEIEVDNDKIKIINKKNYLPRTNNDLNISDVFDGFCSDYSYLNIKDKKDIYGDQFLLYSNEDEFLIRKTNSIKNPRLIGNKEKTLLNDNMEDERFSKSKDGVLKGIIMPSIDSGAGIYMDVRGNSVYIKTASKDPISSSVAKDSLVYKIEFEKGGESFPFEEENIHIKNYFKMMTYNLIKFKNTSKKSFIEKIMDIEINN